MTINIHKESLVGDIQKQFSESYPFLKIDFLKYNSHKHPAKETTAQPNELFRNLAGSANSVSIDIDGKKTVVKLENDFKYLFGITAEISRKSGNLWIETSLTDDWTLEKQNKEGEQLSHYSQTVVQQTNSLISYPGEQNKPGADTD